MSSRTASVKNKISNSKQRFQNIVWPKIRHWFGGGELVAGESVNERIANILDTEAGVDFYAVKSGKGIITLASRVQKTACFRTHTARYDTGTDYDTEVQKRLRQLKLGMLTPQFTVQAYVRLDDEFDSRCVTGALRNAAAVRTSDLYDYIDQTDKGQPPGARFDMPDGGGWYLRDNEKDDNSFICVPWRLFANSYDIRVCYRAQAELPPPPQPRKITPWWRSSRCEAIE